MMLGTIPGIISLVLWETMLEDLDRYDWSGLGHPNIPRWLEGITSVDVKIRRRSLGYIDRGYILEEYTTDGNLDPAYPLSLGVMSFIIPFIVELLSSNLVYDKIVMVEWLRVLASYHTRFHDRAGEFGLGHEHLENARMFYVEVQAGKSVYEALLHNGDKELVKATQSLLDEIG
jgi:hypothetical protein